MPNLKFKSGTSVKMDGTLPKIPFLKLQGRGAQITPRDHNITQNIHIKIFLMRGPKYFWDFDCLDYISEKVYHWVHYIFCKDVKNVKLDHAPSFICLGKYFHTFFQKKILGLSRAIGVFPSLLPCNGKCECSVHIFRGPWIPTYQNCYIHSHI